MAHENARLALEQLDRAMVDKPRTDGNAFSLAAQYLSAMRDDMAMQQRADGPTPASRKRLEHVNAIISVVLAGHFPLGGIPWDELDRARAWLVDFAEEWV